MDGDDNSLLLLLRRLEDLERAEQALVHTHHRARVVEFTTVIGRREERDELTLGEELVAVLDDLMRTTYQVHVVLLQESRDYVWSECERDTAVVLAPAGDVLVGIRPEQIAEETAVWDLQG